MRLHPPSVVVFSGSSNRPLVQEICNHLGISPGPMDIRRFSDGEIYCRPMMHIRGKEVFVIQSTNGGSENIIELLIMIDALKRASAEKITVVVPYFGYARQDRKTKSRESIAAKMMANIIQTAGATRFMSIDLHAGQIQGFFDIPSDNLTAALLFKNYFLSKHLEHPVIVSPDMGGVERAKVLSRMLHCDIAVCQKNRTETDKVDSIHLIGEVQGKSAILMDDIISTGGTLCKASELLMEKGAKEVYACISHGLFVSDCLEKMNSSVFTEIVVTNSVDHPREFLQTCPKLKILSVAPLIAEAIFRICMNMSLSEVFDDISGPTLFKDHQLPE
ncbi:MAG: ribose-phosphate pyrophosphokinase [Caldisericia bacterium]|nr:ribose-phosphate pyrophosphokinase [Caldisericia bacterium]MDD4614131.1 ribose-phosphate pyrophosphokinase [Caldisericia bacterium]